MISEYPTLRTARLTLRPLLESDAKVLHRIYQSEGVLRYFPNPIPPSFDKLQKFIEGQLKHWKQHGYGNWGILPEGSDKIIGWVGLQYLPELDETEVGFLLDRPFWGKGFATETARASIHFGFEQLKLDHIIALVHPENQASIRVIEKCGMEYQNILPLWGMHLNRYRTMRPA